MTDKEKIRNEVERLMNDLIQEKEKGYGFDIDDACILELQNLLTFIDSLQEEPVSKEIGNYDHKAVMEALHPELKEEPASNDMEEVLKKYLTSLRKSHFEGYDIERAFKKGAQWQKEQLIAKTCVFLGSTDFCKYYNKEFIEEFKKTMEG